jgi:hypothetical protein
MIRVGDGQLPGPDSVVGGNHHPVVGDGDRVQIRGHVHEPADHARVNGVVVREHANVAVAGHPDRVMEHHVWDHGWQRAHRLPVLSDQVGGFGPSGPRVPGVRDR